MTKLHIVVDVESDGPCPGLYSMVSFGAVVVEDLTLSGIEGSVWFYGQTAPLHTAKWDPEALAVSNTTRLKHIGYPHGSETMAKFHRWLMSLGAERLVFVSDNPAFDWQWINHGFHYFLDGKGFSPINPFGHSARRIGDIWSGYRRKFNDHSSWKDLRKTRHTHNPVDDARGNVEALREIMRRMEAQNEAEEILRGKRTLP